MTNTVTFPGLGFEFELNRVVFSVFGHDIYWYGVIIACGFLLAVGYSLWKAPKYQMNQEKIIDMLFFAVPLCIIGARAYYVIFNPAICFDGDGKFSFYRMIAIWDGGLAIYGAIIVAILVVLLHCKVRREPLWSYLDLGSLGVMIGQLVGRWGNFVNVEAYGSLTTGPWRMCSKSIANYLWNQGYITTSAEYQSILDGTVGVHPTFFYESVWNLLGFLILAALARKGRKVQGQTFAGYLIWYGLGRAVIESLRTDSLYFFGTGIRSSQMVGIISVIAGIIILAVRIKLEKNAPAKAVQPAGGEQAVLDSAEPVEDPELTEATEENNDGGTD